MSGAELKINAFRTREEASGAAARAAAEVLERDVSRHGRSSLMVSGGSTPERMLALLSEARLPWPAVTVGLVDERWVPPSHPESNERLVRTHLLRGPAGAAGFVPLYTFDENPEAARADRDTAYTPHCRPPGVVLLGMGTDGHTASWFPGMANLNAVAAPDQPGCVASVTAPSAAVPERMTLTGAAVLNARHALLLVFGDDKRSVLSVAHRKDHQDCPIRFAVDGLGDRLSIFWAR